MAKKELKKMSKNELIEIIYALQNNEENEKIPEIDDVKKERNHISYQKRYRKALRSTAGILIVIAAIAVLIATIFFPVLQVTGDSMEPTLEDKDIIVLKKSNNFNTGDLCSFSWQNKLLIKRVIGKPGDIININKAGVVYVNGKQIKEPYVDDLALGKCDITFPYQVPENRYFVLGDHRSVSIDSRSSEIGCIEKDQIVGKVVIRIWPLSQFSFIK